MALCIVLFACSPVLSILLSLRAPHPFAHGVMAFLDLSPFTFGCDVTTLLKCWLILTDLLCFLAIQSSNSFSGPGMGVADSQTFFIPLLPGREWSCLETGCFVFIKEQRKTRRGLTLRALSSTQLGHCPHRFIQLVVRMRQNILALNPIW